jgi:hypothetical protein
MSSNVVKLHSARPPSSLIHGKRVAITYDPNTKLYHFSFTVKRTLKFEGDAQTLEELHDRAGQLITKATRGEEGQSH